MNEKNSNFAVADFLTEAAEKDLHFPIAVPGVKPPDFLLPEPTSMFHSFEPDFVPEIMLEPEMDFPADIAENIILDDFSGNEQIFEKSTLIAEEPPLKFFWNDQPLSAVKVPKADEQIITALPEITETHKTIAQTAEFTLAELDSVIIPAHPAAETIEEFTAEEESAVFDLAADALQPPENVPNYRTNPELFLAAILQADEKLVSIEDKYLVFKSEESFYSFPAANVVEISRPLPVALLPGAPVWLLGIINLRGEIVPVVSLRRFWGKPQITAAKPKFIILQSRREEFRLGLMVDEVREIRHLTAEKIHAPATSRDSFVEVCLQGTAKYTETAELLLLDAEKFLALPRFKNLD